MNVLSIEKQVQVLMALVDGNSIRNVERMLEIHQSLRVTPAMEAGIENHIWTMEEILVSQ